MFQVAKEREEKNYSLKKITHTHIDMHANSYKKFFSTLHFFLKKRMMKGTK